MKKTSVKLVLLFVLSICATIQAQELVIQYTFDEADLDAIDTGTGDKSNGVLGPTAARTTITPGNISAGALDLRAEGTDSFLNAGDPDEVDTLESFTLTTWLLLDGLNADQDGSGNVRLLAKQGPDPFNGFSWNLNSPNLGLRGTDNFRTGLFVGGESGFSFAFASEDVYADEWAFLAVTYDGTSASDNAAFYFGDTQLEVFLLADEMQSIGAGPVASTKSVADFGIGFTDAAADVDFSAVGFMDDVRVYDGVLSVEQLEAVRLENLTVMEMPACDPESGGDIDGDGQVGFPDFLILSSNFGTAATSHTEGDIDCDGQVGFPDFLVLSSNFGAGGAAVASVPEPSAGVMMMGLLLCGLPLRQRTRT